MSGTGTGYAPAIGSRYPSREQILKEISQLEQRCLGKLQTVKGGFHYESLDKVVKRLKAKGAPSKFIQEIIDDAKRQAEAREAFASYKGPILKAKLVSSEMVQPVSLEDALKTLLDCGVIINNKQVKIGFDSHNEDYLPTPYVVGPVDGKRLIWSKPKQSLHSGKYTDTAKPFRTLFKVVTKELYPGVTRVLDYVVSSDPHPALEGRAFHIHTTKGRMPDLKYRRFHI